MVRSSSREISARSSSRSFLLWAIQRRS